MKNYKYHFLTLLFASALTLGSCGTNKKKDCDTCPKWTSSTEPNRTGVNA